ncbi:hypothetical protein H0H87_005754, partial [Tephrocybe sp. NHM501043]
MSTSFIDPATLSESETGSPVPSSSNPRKRPRTESSSSSEERKEARAHRNRIAAQNSRDRRKAQFSYLERRVAELEEENRALRAARGVPLLPVRASTAFKAEEEHKRLEAHARERENEELKQRIKTLEQGWDAVLKALAAQGLPLAPSTPAPPTTTTITYPISPAPSSPASLDFTPSPSALARPLESSPTESTRHLARVATMPHRMSLQRALFPSPPHTNTSTPSSLTTSTDPDDATMETLFMEILAEPALPLLAPSPAAAPATTRAAHEADAHAQVEGPSAKVASPASSTLEVFGGEAFGPGVGAGAFAGMEEEGTGAGEWDSGLEMQRILASLGVDTEGTGTAETEKGLEELEMGWMNYEGIG